jgi:protein O-GlcNAc transferase
VQATWMGYPGTTGLDSIDYIIADAVEIPSGAEAFYSERPIRLPGSYVCYAPPDYAPAPRPSARGDEPVSFGCFNNLAKLNDAVFSAWARILASVPRSRLKLLWPSLLDPAIATELRARLAAAGVPAERVELGGHRRHEDLLAAYRTVDIALDPFPYTGGLTTLEALWMGVPVLTIAGDTFAGRHSASHLTAAGLADWIASSPDDYVRLAAGWADRRRELASIGAGLRDRLRGSPLCDGARFTASLESAYEAMWRGGA